MLELIQGSDAWKAARCGSLGASQVADALAKTKTGWGASRGNVMATLIVERLTQTPTEMFVNAAMQWGTDKEPEACDAYAFHYDADLTTVGLVKHPAIEGTHASPDRLVGAEGLIEVKCPLTATHIDTIISNAIPGRYITQMDWQMACTGRQWCDYVSYDPRLPEDMRLFVRRHHRVESRIAELEADVRLFLSELEDRLAALKEAVRPVARAA